MSPTIDGLQNVLCIEFDGTAHETRFVAVDITPRMLCHVSHPARLCDVVVPVTVDTENLDSVGGFASMFLPCMSDVDDLMALGTVPL
jgi:hypothetical protein